MKFGLLLLLLLYNICIFLLGCSHPKKEIPSPSNKVTETEYDEETELKGIDTVAIQKSLPPFVFKVDFDTTGNNNGLILSIFKKGASLPFQTIKDSSDRYKFAHLVDMNLDGYQDISFGLIANKVTPNHEVWLFDSTEKQFVLSEEFSGLGDYLLDKANRRITSHDVELGGKGGNENTYEILNGHLSILSTAYSDRDESERKTLVRGILTTIQKSEVTELDDNEYPTVEVSDFEWILDSLRLKQQTVKKQIDPNLTDSLSKNNILDNTLWGVVYLYIQKDVFDYKQLSNGNIVQTKDKYKVIDGKWILIDE
jgi:hypothetical protein